MVLFVGAQRSRRIARWARDGKEDPLNMTRKTTPTETEVTSNPAEAAKSLLGHITEIVGQAPKLSTKDRQRSQKLRKGGETIISTVAALSEKFGLTVASHPTAAMLEDSKKAQSLIPIHRDLDTATKQVADQIFAANSKSWAAATVHYSMLKRLAKTNGDLEAALAPVEQFFSKVSPTVAAERKAAREAAKAAKAAKALAKANAKVKPQPPVETSESAPARDDASPAPTPPAATPPHAAPAPPAPTGAATT
jgi:hypothetical protein